VATDLRAVVSQVEIGAIPVLDLILAPDRHPVRSGKWDSNPA